MVDDAVQRLIVVFQDDAGNCYVLPLDVLAAAHVRPEDRAGVERALAGDTSGYILCNGAPPASIQPAASAVPIRCDLLPGRFAGGLQVVGLFPLGKA